MEIGQAEERLGAFGRLLDHGGPAVCHLDDLGRSAHDDMTINRGETFMPAPGQERPPLAAEDHRLHDPGVPP